MGNWIRPEDRSDREASEEKTLALADAVGVAQRKRRQQGTFCPEQREVVGWIGSNVRASCKCSGPLDLGMAIASASCCSRFNDCGRTCALVAISPPSPTANPVPRKLNAGLRARWNVPTMTTELLTRAIVSAGDSAPDEGTGQR